MGYLYYWLRPFDQTNPREQQLAGTCSVNHVFQQIREQTRVARGEILEKFLTRVACRSALVTVKNALLCMKLRILILFLAMAASGCTSLKNATPTIADAKPSPVLRETINAEGQSTDNTIRHETGNARIAQLWAEAERSRLAGDDIGASRFILQAIEVEPRDSVLLSRAAELQLQLGQPVLAESYAVRSNTLAESNRPLMLRNWMIIEHSRDIRGDLLGVRTAHRMVQQFRN